jgi:hypothetical protein
MTPTEAPTSKPASNPTTPTREPVAPTPEPATPTLQSITPTSEPVLPPGVVSGVVQNDAGPVADALVRVRNTDFQTTSESDGSFTLTDLPMTEPVSVTAWLEGHYIGATSALPGSEPVTLELNEYSTVDNLDYDFASAQKCAECHVNYPEWQADAHGGSAVNARFLTMYEGTDVDGNKSPPSYNSVGQVQLPDLSQPYYGPGYRLDYRDRSGNCAACHTPAAASLETKNTCGWMGCHTNFTAQMSEQVPYGVHPTGLEGAAAEGINCDFCHKIGDVILDEETKLPYAAKPGISSLRVYRPDEGHDLFFGPLDDVPDPDSYLPLQEESAFCAPCHYGVFGGVVGHSDVTGGVDIYNSYGEWLESPYSDPETGQTCQDCHMPLVDYEYIVAPENGGMRRGADRIHNHTMPGANDEKLLQNAVTMTTTAQMEGDAVAVEVSITNDKTGHHVPTDSPLRHLILVVGATDANGNPLPLVHGPELPDWTGDYAGQAGRYYAKILQDEWTGEVPTAAYWRDIDLVEDTRLAAFATDVSQYSFAAPAGGEITVDARLLYRRAFQALMEQKGWDDADILMEEDTVALSGQQ